MTRSFVFLLLLALPASMPAVQTATASEPQKPTEEQQNEAPGADEDVKQQANPRVQVIGKAVDDATGKPIPVVVTQAGKFDPDSPDKVTWGYSEGRSSRRDGSFSTSIRWGEGWTARVLADGYLPQPVVDKAPPAGEKRIEVTLRLKRGSLLRARVVDHEGNPVKGAAVFANGALSLNLYQGNAWQSWGGKNESAKPAYTDDDGWFELQLGSATRLAISHASIDAWAAAIPEGDDKVIRLPEPARLEIVYDIDGAGDKGEIFYQLLGHDMPGFKGLESTRNVPIENGGNLILDSLTPGKYQFTRYKMLQLDEMGIGTMLERKYLDLKPGEKKTIQYVRKRGARLTGTISWPDGVAFSGMLISVRSIDKTQTPISSKPTAAKYSAQVVSNDGTYQTERISPGKYLLQAAAYEPMKPEARFSTGIQVPSYRAEMTITVPESGELKVPNLKLEKAEPRFDF